MARPRKDPVVELTVEEKIAAAEAEIASLNDEIKGKKKELRALNKKKSVADLLASAKKAEEDNNRILEALKTSGKTVEEVLEFLK